jgi:hypothetical protein
MADLTAAEAVIAESVQLPDFSSCTPRIWQSQAAGFVGIFIPVQISGKTVVSKAQSRSQEKLVSRISRSAQSSPQFLRSTSP